MYLQQFHRANYKNVTQFLIKDPFFPRAIRFCIDTAAKSLQFITETLNVPPIALEEIYKLQNLIHEANIDTILNNGMHEFIDLIQFNLNVIDEVLYKSFFSLEKSDAPQYSEQL